MTPENYLKYGQNYGMRPEFQKITIENSEIDPANQKIYERVIEWPTESGKGFYIFGKPGTGKSHALKIKANMLYEIRVKSIVERTSNLKYPQWIDLSTFVKEVTKNNSFDTSNDDRATRVMDSAKNADYLFIDDFGATSNTPSVVSIIFDLIDARISNKKMTYVSSNLDSNGILDFYGPRLHSRMFELCTFIRLEGNDRRRSM